MLFCTQARGQVNNCLTAHQQKVQFGGNHIVAHQQKCG